MIFHNLLGFYDKNILGIQNVGYEKSIEYSLF